MERHSRVLRLISKAGLTLESPLHSRFVRHPLTDHGLSLLGMLKQDAAPEEAFHQSLIKAIELTALFAVRAQKNEKPLTPPVHERFSQNEKKVNPVFDYVLL